MKKIYLLILSLTSLFATHSTANTACMELPHADGFARDICSKNNKEYLILEFILPSCSACHRNVSQIKKLEGQAQGYAHSRIISLRGINDTLPFIQRYAISTEVALDSNSQAKRLFGVRGVPAVVVLDQFNQIVYQTAGYLDDAKISDIISIIMRPRMLANLAFPSLPLTIF